MAKQNPLRTGSWLVAEEFYERGDAAFVDELRLVCDPDRLGKFASRWYADSRRASRQMLLSYLDQPFNAFRHEVLLKRLFKLAEKASDDEVMSRFLVGFDRSIRRLRKKKHHYNWTTRQQWTTEHIVTPLGTAMPRDRRQLRYRNPNTGELMAAPTPAKQAAMQLFSLRTRKYLRLRSWRYLRQLAHTQPDRFVPAAVTALQLYQDADVSTGLALLDNWSLVHLLFHESPILQASASGWKLAEGRALSELSPAPAFESLWKKAPDSLIHLLLNANCRPVRQWALQLLRSDHPLALDKLPLRTLVEMLSHEDEEVAVFAADAMRRSTDLGRITPEEWLAMVESSSPQTLSVLTELMQKHLAPSSLTLSQIISLTCSRPFPVANLGFEWLKTSAFDTSDDVKLVSHVANAQADSLRPQMIQWLRSRLSNSPFFNSSLLLDLLDSRHADVRMEAWDWLTHEGAVREDVSVWQKLLESPFDDIRLKIVHLLEQHASEAGRKEWTALARSSRLNPELTRVLWATVLLNVQNAHRRKPGVVRQIVQRLEKHPEETTDLIPILSVALRSLRGPEWRAGLTAIVQISESHPQMNSLIQQHFPELKLGVFSPT